MPLVRANIAAIAGYVPGEQPRDRRYTKLNTNENPYPPSPKVAAALRDFAPARLRLYPDPLAQELRQVAGEQFGFAPDWILAGNGSDDLLTIAMRTFVDQGGKLAYLTPSYSLYPVLADLQGAAGVPVPLDPDFGLPANAAALAGDATLLLIARPNAPTGTAFPLASVERVCREFRGVVWIDEAYVDFGTDHCLEFARKYPNVVVSRTVSKSYCLAGLRLGLAFARPELIVEMMKVKDSYNASMLTQLVGVAALRDREYMEACGRRIRAARDTLSTALRKLGFVVLPSAANFIFVQPPAPATAKEMFRQLRERGFLVRYFARDRIDTFFRITIGTEADMRAFLQATQEILAPPGRT